MLFTLGPTTQVTLVLNESCIQDKVIFSPILRATLEESVRSRVQWNWRIILVKSHKLDPWPLDEGSKPKENGKMRLNLHGTFWMKNQLVETPPQKSSKESSWFGELRCKLVSNSKIQFASNGSKLVPRNLNPWMHLKWAARCVHTWC